MPGIGIGVGLALGGGSGGGLGGTSLPTLAFASPSSRTEGNGGGTAFAFTLNLTRNGIGAAVPFTWAVTGTGAAPADATDFVGGALPTGSGVFATGEASKTITVTVAGDTIVEPDENFALTASASLPLAPAITTGTILNDDVTAPAPVNTAAPTVSGTAASGNSLTVGAGAWSNAPTGYAYQWQRKVGAAYAVIPGATASSYTVQAGDGVNLRCLVTASNAGGSAAQQSGPCQYLGQVATKCMPAFASSTGNRQLMSRSPHFARDAITSLKVVLGNWWCDQQPNPKYEYGSGGTATYTASIEYPAGTFTQLLFGGAAGSGAVADGANAVSDFAAVTIAKDALFWVRVYCVASNAIVFQGGIASVNTSVSDVANGQAMTYAGSGVADQTMGGTVANTNTSSTAPCYTPIAIVANTTVPSVFIAGDSRSWAAGDAYDASGDRGEVARSIGATMPYINAGLFGDQVATAKANYAKRATLLQYCSHVVQEAGINDLSASGGYRTAAALFADLGTLWSSYFAGKPIWATTLPPRTTSSDSWATVANQTVDANNAERVTYNNSYVRAVASPLAGCFEVADAIESARDSGKLKATGAANGYTIDGVHESQAGYLLEKNGGGVVPASLTR